GDVYRMYKDKIIESDAEVALTFDPDSLRAVTEPLVNIRYSVLRALEKQIIQPEIAEKIIQTAKDTYFYDLTYYYLFNCFEENDRELEPFKQFVMENRKELDLKQKDALKLIEYLNTIY